MKVFISSVVTGFDNFRSAAKRAIELVDSSPVMCEDFGALPYSSERACVTGVESSDVFILMLGERFGFEQAPGVSVTQQEFRHACGMSLPVLVFVQNVPLEDRQVVFAKEVEDYHSGFSRETFSTPEELKDKIVRTLNRLERARAAISEQEFEKRLDDTATNRPWSGRSGHDKVFSFAFLPQPSRDIDLRQLVAGRNDTFTLLARVGLASLQYGFKPIEERDHTGLETKQTILRQYDDGLILLDTKAATESSERLMMSFHVSPAHVRKLGEACFSLVNANSGWCRIGLHGMQTAMLAEPPAQAGGSVQMPMRNEDSAVVNGCLIPFTESAYKAWVDKAVAKLERRLG